MPRWVKGLMLKAQQNTESTPRTKKILSGGSSVGDLRPNRIQRTVIFQETKNWYCPLLFRIHWRQHDQVKIIWSVTQINIFINFLWTRPFCKLINYTNFPLSRSVAAALTDPETTSHGENLYPQNAETPLPETHFTTDA